MELVDQNVFEAPLVVLAHRVVVAQHLKTAQHQLTKIHHALALALRFVQRIQLNLLLRVFVSRGHIAWALPVFFAAADEVLQLLGWKALGIDVELLAQALHRRKLVLRVQNLKCGRQARQLVVGTQKAVAQAVKRADPHAAHVHRQHAGEPGHHLFGRLVGEGHRHHAARSYLPGLQQPGNAGGEHPRFARPGAGEDERVLGRQGDGGSLLGVQANEQRRRIHGVLKKHG